MCGSGFVSILGGGFRRGKQVGHDVDILITADAIVNPDPFINRIMAKLGEEQVLQDVFLIDGGKGSADLDSEVGRSAGGQRY